MNKEQALQVLEQALNVASKAGVFNLQDSATLFTAISILKQEVVSQLESKETEVKSNKK